MLHMKKEMYWKSLNNNKINNITSTTLTATLTMTRTANIINDKYPTVSFYMNLRNYLNTNWCRAF